MFVERIQMQVYVIKKNRRSLLFLRNLLILCILIVSFQNCLNQEFQVQNQSGLTSSKSSNDSSSSVEAKYIDLCVGMNQTKNLVGYSSLAKPELGQTIVDPDFGTKITRITDVAKQWPGRTTAVPVYPTIPTWNADESLLFLYIRGEGHALFNGKTYQFLKILDINPPDLEQVYWDTKNPDILYYIDNMQNNAKIVYTKLTKYHVSSGVKEVLHDFANDIKSGGKLATACANGLAIGGGEDPFFTSLDNDLIGLGCALPENGPNGAVMFNGFTYRISTNEIGAIKKNEATVPQAMPQGKMTFSVTDLSSIQVYNPISNDLIRNIPIDGSEHGDMLINAKGEEIFASVQYDGPSGSGSLLFANLSTGVVKTMIGEAAGDKYPPGGTLISGRAYKNPGWVGVAIAGDPKSSSNLTGVDYLKTGTFLDQEIILANIDVNTKAPLGYCRVGRHRTFNIDGYWGQPNITMSPSGTRLIYQSDWGGGSTIDTYVISLPSYNP